MARRTKFSKRRFGRRRRNAIPKGLHAPRAQLKTYNYNFQLAPQLIQSSLSAISTVALNTNSPNVPIDSSGGFLNLSSTVGFPGVADWSAACTHKLNDIANFAQFTALYDAYKINSVTVTLEYLSNSANVNGGGIMPTFYMYWDQDDAIPPTTVATMLGKTGVKKFQPTSSKLMKKFRYVPVTANLAFTSSSVGAPAIIPNKSQWIDCQNTNVEHYALKLYGQDFTAQGNPASLNMLRVHYTYNVSFRSPLRCT